MKRVPKPKTFKMPDSKAPVADVGHAKDRYVQVHAAGTYDPKTARRLAAWLLRAADWMEKK